MANRPAIEEMKRMMERVTPAPWQRETGYNLLWNHDPDYPVRALYPLLEAHRKSHWQKDKPSDEQLTANIDFVAEARSFIPALIEYVEGLERALQTIENMDVEVNHFDGCDKYRQCKRIAREALK